MKKFNHSLPVLTFGFTLIELLVSVSIISLIMVVLAGMTNQISQTWRSTTGKIEQFQEARDGFESMTRKLAQATLNTYWDINYIQSSGRDLPTDYVRASQLRFVSGPMARLTTGTQWPTHGVFFQAPLGYVKDSSAYGRMDGLLNTWGYFLEIGDDTDTKPPFLGNLTPVRSRSRLMEMMQPSENLAVYNLDLRGATAPTPGSQGVKQLVWFSDALTTANRPVRVLAENVIALVVWPRLAKKDEDLRRDAGMSALSPNYLYDSSLLSFASSKYGTSALPMYLNDGAYLNSTSSADEAGPISPKNQLPPLLQVTMVALDEASASRLRAAKGATATADLVKGLFTVAVQKNTSSTTPSTYTNDLGTLEGRMKDAHLSYRIFTADVTIHGAKWSALQTK